MSVLSKLIAVLISMLLINLQLTLRCLSESLTKEVNQKEEELINSNANFKELEKQKLKIKNLKQSISETEVLTTESKNAYSDGLKNFASNSAYIHE
eukprot:Pgem_evm1s12234